MILAALAFVVASTTFKAESVMPKRTVYDKDSCTGSNRSPELHWSGAPAGTRSFAIIMHDPDAPAPGGWYHWVVYGLPPGASSLKENAQIPNANLGTNSFGSIGYGGPCPPPGKPHRYETTIYALDVAAIDGKHLTGPQLERAIAHHTIAQARVTGLFGR